MPALRDFLRRAPRTVVVFSTLHVLIGLCFLWGLISMHCVDQPAPPGTYLIDGCSASYDPWRVGHALYLFVLVLVFIASSLWLLRANGRARVTVPMTLGVLACALCLSVGWASLTRNPASDAKYGWGVAWVEGLQYFSLTWWLILAGWVMLDVWFLFASPARRYFAAPPNTSLERTRDR
jgi:hypothetical protein